MDDEAAADIKQAMLKHKISHPSTPPHMHKINAAERPIQTYKNQVLAGLASVNPSFPINKWDHILQ